MIDPLLPEPLDARSCQFQVSAEAMVILARTTAPTAACPACGQVSSRVHSRYTRTLTDLPWHGRPVRRTHRPSSVKYRQSPRPNTVHLCDTTALNSLNRVTAKDVAGAITVADSRAAG